MTSNVKSFCGSCGTQWESEQPFCTGCGERREGTAPPPVPSQAAPEQPVPPQAAPGQPVPPQAESPQAGPPAPPQAGPPVPPQIRPPVAPRPGPQLPPNVPVPGAPSTRTKVPGWAIALVAVACVLVLAVGIGVSVLVLGGGDSGEAAAPSGGSTVVEGAPATGSHPLGQDAAVAWTEEITHDVRAMDPVHAAGDRVFVHQKGVTSVRDLGGEELYSFEGPVADIGDGKALVLQKAPIQRAPETLALVSAEDGTEIWSRDLGGRTPNVAKLTAHGVLIEISREVTLLDLETGDEVWSKEAGWVEEFSRSGDVLVAKGRDAVRAMEVGSGKVLVEKELDDPHTHPNVMVTDDVFVMAEGLIARAWDLESAQKVWQEKFDLDTDRLYISPVKPFELPDGAVLLQGYDDESFEYEYRVRDSDGGTGKEYPSEEAPRLLFTEEGEEFVVTRSGEVLDSDLEKVNDVYGATRHVPGGLYVFDFGDVLKFFQHGESLEQWTLRLGDDAGEGSLQGVHLVDGGVVLHWRERIVMVR